MNIIYYTSAIKKREFKSVLMAKLFASIDEFYVGYLVSQTFARMIGRDLGLTMYSDSR